MFYTAKFSILYNFRGKGETEMYLKKSRMIRVEKHTFQSVFEMQLWCLMNIDIFILECHEIKNEYFSFFFFFTN